MLSQRHGRDEQDQSSGGSAPDVFAAAERPDVENLLVALGLAWRPPEQIWFAHVRIPRKSWLPQLERRVLCKAWTYVAAAHHRRPMTLLCVHPFPPLLRAQMTFNAHLGGTDKGGTQ